MLMRIYPQSCAISCTPSVVEMLLRSNDGVTITNPIVTMTVVVMVVVVAVHLILELIRLRQEFQRLSLCLRNRISTCVAMERFVVVSASFVVEAAGSEIFATGFVAGGGAALGCFVYQLVYSISLNDVDGRITLPEDVVYGNGQDTSSHEAEHDA